jgi:hypothetical protein
MMKKFNVGQKILMQGKVYEVKAIEKFDRKMPNLSRYTLMTVPGRDFYYNQPGYLMQPYEDKSK